MRCARDALRPPSERIDKQALAAWQKRAENLRTERGKKALAFAKKNIAMGDDRGAKLFLDQAILIDPGSPAANEAQELLKKYQR